MANKTNLKANTERTPKERKELAQKAGKKSGEKRRERKLLKEELLLLLSEGDNQKRMSVALFQKALEGDVKAFAMIRDIIGENPAILIETESKTPVFNITVTDERMKKMLEEL